MKRQKKLPKLHGVQLRRIRYYRWLLNWRAYFKSHGINQSYLSFKPFFDSVIIKNLQKRSYKRTRNKIFRNLWKRTVFDMKEREALYSYWFQPNFPYNEET